MNDTFVARQPELDLLQQALTEAQSVGAQIRFVSGEAGSGKTALVTEFARQVQASHPEMLVATGTCNAHTGTGDPYLPLRQVLAGLTGIEQDRSHAEEHSKRRQSLLKLSAEVLAEFGPDLVGLLVPGAALVARIGAFAIDQASDKIKELAKKTPPVPGEIERERIFEQLTKVLRKLAEHNPCVLILDDLQWADAGSLELLFYLGRNLGDSSVLVVGTYRPAEVSIGRGSGRHPLEKLVSEFRRLFGSIEIDLDSVDLEEGQGLINALIDRESNRLGPDFRRALYNHTGGNPLFAVELLQHLKDEGYLINGGKGLVSTGDLDWQALPARVEGVVEERIARLEEDLRDILSVASVEGETFTAQVISQVEGVQERQLLRRLSREVERRHRLAYETEEITVGEGRLSRYAFAHALFQTYLYKSLGAGERRLLHRDVAVVLETLYADDLDEIAVQLARHYVEAGYDDKAIVYLLRSGDQARRLFAYAEAIYHYERAVPLLRRTGDVDRLARTLMKLGLTHHLDFHFDQSRKAYEEAFGLWQQAVDSGIKLPAAPHPLRIDWPYQPLTLDPAYAADGDTVGVVDQLFDGLVGLSPDLEVVPEMAARWEVLDEGTKYIFHLRDAVWSDGVPVTAHDFEYAWKRALDPATDSPTASLLADLQGARALLERQIESTDTLGVEAVDAKTLVVTLEQPVGYFLHLLTYAVSYPVPRHVVQREGADWTVPTSLVTNGPYRLAFWDEDKGALLLRRNSLYTGRFAGNVGQVALVSIDSSATRLVAYEQDKLDVLSLWNFDDGKVDVRQKHPDEYASAPLTATTYVGFDVSRPPFDDVRVRRAFAHALDRERWAHEELGGRVFPGDGGFVPPGMPGHVGDFVNDYVPDLAAGLLREAGYGNGCSFPPVRFLLDEGNDRPSAFIAAQWEENLGVAVDRETVEWDDFVAAMETEPPNVFMGIWMADYPDPDNFLRVCDAIRWTQWRDRGYEQLIKWARHETDHAKRMKMYAEAERMLIDQAVLVPFAYWRTHLLLKPWVTHYPTSVIKWWYWRDVVIESH